MKWMRMLKGEPMPDYDAPENQQKKERYKGYGARFCRWMRLDKLACNVQMFAMRHPKRFFSIVGMMMLLVISLNIRNAYLSYSYRTEAHSAKEAAIEAKKQRLEYMRVKADSLTTNKPTLNNEPDHEP